MCTWVEVNGTPSREGKTRETEDAVMGVAAEGEHESERSDRNPVWRSRAW